MSIPFTSEGFYGVFSAYNLALWPAQVFLLGLGVIAIALLALQRSYSSAGISGILTFLWAWQALAYHLAFFTVGMGAGLNTVRLGILRLRIPFPFGQRKWRQKVRMEILRLIERAGLIIAGVRRISSLNHSRI